MEKMLPSIISWLALGLYVGILSQLTLLWTGLTIRPTAPRRALLWVAVGAYVRWTYAAVLIIIALRQDIVFALMSVLGLCLSRWGFVWYLREGEALSRIGFEKGEKL